MTSGNIKIPTVQNIKNYYKLKRKAVIWQPFFFPDFELIITRLKYLKKFFAAAFLYIFKIILDILLFRLLYY